MFSGEKPFLCDKCGRGFNRVDNLRSHVRTVHHGKAGMKRLVVAGESASELSDECTGMSTSDEIKIVTVTTEDIVTLATEALAAAQLTGWRLSLRFCLKILLLDNEVFICWSTVVPVAASVSADETEALKAEISKAVEKVQEAGESCAVSMQAVEKHPKNNLQ